jgi:hypothetical protein
MAGSDQSRNLGGMMSQIGNTLGSSNLGSAFKDLMVNTQAPAINPQDPASLDRAAQYAARTGNAQNAALYARQASERRAEMKKLEDEQKAQNKAVSANAVTAQYKMALETGDAATIKKAEDMLMAGANEHGYSALDRMNAASTAVKRQNDEAFELAERERTAKERAATEQFSKEINSTDDADAIIKAVENAPPEMRDQAQRMANARLGFLANVEKQAEANAAKVADVSTDFTPPEGLPESIAKGLRTEHERLQKLAKDMRNPDGTWKDGGKRAVQEGMKKLNEKAFQAEVGLAVSEESDKRQRLRTIDNKRANVSISTPTKQQFEAIEETLAQETATPGRLWGTNPGEPTYEDVIERFRSDQMEALDAEARAIMGEDAEEDDSTDKDPSRGAKKGETRTDKNGVEWQWDGTKWNRV